MVPRSFSSVVTAETIALNAFIYGYAGHSLVTPHRPLQQVWWTDGRVRNRVNADFVRSRVRPDLRPRLDEPIAGLSELTNASYLDWIVGRARRVFLALLSAGLVDRLFDAIDASWDDDDLPVGIDMIESMLQSGPSDPARQLYSAQFIHLLRELGPGDHVDYADSENVPVEYVHRPPPAVALQPWFRVRLAGGNVFVRRKFVICRSSPADGQSTANFHPPLDSDRNARLAQFKLDVGTIQSVRHPHMMPIFASYSVGSTAFTLSSFDAQHTLRTFIDHRKPAQIASLDRGSRQMMVLRWLGCLASVVAAIHSSGRVHGNIHPTRIVIDDRNTIAFSDLASLPTFQFDQSTPFPPSSSSSPSPSPAPSSAQSHSSASPSFMPFPPEKSGYAAPELFCSSASAVSSMTAAAAADVFSLACIFLDIIAFAVKKRAGEFTKFRPSQPKQPLPDPDIPTNSTTPKPKPGTTSIFSTIPKLGFRSKSKPALCLSANLDRLHAWIDVLEHAVHTTIVAPITPDRSGVSGSRPRRRGWIGSRSGGPGTTDEIETAAATAGRTKSVELAITALSLCRQMLHVDPDQRPTAREVCIGLVGFGRACFCNPADRDEVGIQKGDPVGDGGPSDLSLADSRETKVNFKIDEDDHDDQSTMEREQTIAIDDPVDHLPGILKHPTTSLDDSTLVDSPSAISLHHHPPSPSPSHAKRAGWTKNAWRKFGLAKIGAGRIRDVVASG